LKPLLQMSAASSSRPFFICPLARNGCFRTVITMPLSRTRTDLRHTLSLDVFQPASAFSPAVRFPLYAILPQRGGNNEPPSSDAAVRRAIRLPRTRRRVSHSFFVARRVTTLSPRPDGRGSGLFQKVMARRASFVGQQKVFFISRRKSSPPLSLLRSCSGSRFENTGLSDTRASPIFFSTLALRGAVPTG